MQMSPAVMQSASTEHNCGGCVAEADAVVDSVDEAEVSVEAVVVVDTATEESVETVSVRVEVNEVSVEMVDVSLAELAEVVSETTVDSVEVVEGRHGPALTPLAASRTRVLARSRVETMIRSERQGFGERQKREQLE